MSSVSGTEATQGSARPPLGLEPLMLGGHSVDFANWSQMARYATGASRRFDLLAAVADVGRTRRLAGSLVKVAVHAGPAPVAGLGRSLPRRHVPVGNCADAMDDCDRCRPHPGRLIDLESGDEVCANTHYFQRKRSVALAIYFTSGTTAGILGQKRRPLLSPRARNCFSLTYAGGPWGLHYGRSLFFRKLSFGGATCCAWVSPVWHSF